MADTWIIATAADVGFLRRLAEQRSGGVRVVAVGVRVPDAEITLACPKSTPVEALAAKVAVAISAQAGDAVVVSNTPTARVLAGAVAARFNAPILTGVRAATATRFIRERLGGAVIETVNSPDIVVAVSADAPEAAAPKPAVITVDDAEHPMRADESVNPGAERDHAARIVSAQPASPKDPLRGARRIVVAGRGFRAVEDLALARELANAWDAELGCTRPLAEGLGWLPADRCIGVSGVRVAPELYVAIGVSGQLHHLAGALGSRTIVAVNADAGAPVFGQCDYGIVGDLYDIVPQLMAGFEAS